MLSMSGSGPPPWHVFPPSSHNFPELKFWLHTNTGCSAVDKRFQSCLRPVKFRKQRQKVQTIMLLIKGQRLCQDKSRMTEISQALATGLLVPTSKYGVSACSLTSVYDPGTSAMMGVPSSHHWFCENTVPMCLCCARGIHICSEAKKGASHRGSYSNEFL